ncbi:radical SAM protein [Streptomyces tagetis]|uniref:Radical SAM protein n=1 Tax=Streptomyces tagetis TaxID=2820809 RepID=A0A941B8Y4_9ACTN|nr:radical SAM protein [Streptomyces sp. RG38]MBQ0829003.1 radical SAM protein [Streptomyces sp. RG38]
MPVTRTAPTDLESLYAPLSSTGPDTAVSVILKLRGETCDIDCLYCFEKRKESPGGARISAAQIHRLGSIFSGRPLSVELHGGEPLTAGRERIAEILDALAAQPNVIRVSLQTNGLQLDDAWLDLFERHYPELEIGISLDGDALGNSWRVGYDGRPTYPRAVKALNLLGRRDRRVGVICAVTPYVLGRASEVVEHLASFPAVTTVSLVPCFDEAVTRSTTVVGSRAPTSRALQQRAIGPTGPAWAVTPRQYADFVLEAAHHWVAGGMFRRIKLEPVVSVIRRLRGLRTRSCHFSDLKCDHVLTLYPNDRLGSCDELPWPQAGLAALGDVHAESDVAGAQGSSSLLRQAGSLVTKCMTCDYRDTCGAGCPAVRLRFAAAGDEDAYCDHRMRLIDGVAALLAQPDLQPGTPCARLRWRPISPNDMHHVAAFLARWDDPAAPRPPARLQVSTHGNINTVGLPGVHEADDLDPRHPQWSEGIEPGVRPVVDALTAGWNAVTYDSCQGHGYDGVPGAEPRFLSVGILPRDRVEYARTAGRLCRAAGLAEPALPNAYALVLGRSELGCRTTGRVHPTLDLRLVPAADTTPTAYFGSLDQAVRVLTEALAATSSAPPSTPCACATEADAGEGGRQ